MAWDKGNQLPRTDEEDFNKYLLGIDGYIEEREAKILLYKFLRENITFTTDLISGVVVCQNLLLLQYLHIWTQS
mgnify:CR=1 FL=1